MMRFLPDRLRIALLAAAAAAGGPAVQAAPGGPIGVLPLGPYICELPGDATGPAGLRQTAAEFRIVYGSGYRSAAGQGTYLLTGDRMTFTSGPFKGQVYRRIGRSFLRRVLPNGSDGALRCVRQGAGN